jgi:hypothetical protein
MINLTKTAQASGSEDIKNIAKIEIEKIKPTLLPLQQGLTRSSYVGNAALKAVILNITEENNVVKVKAGIFYTGIIAGCSCSDDPSPTDEQTEYCELLFNINKETADTTIILLND